ncbi:MAG: flagellar export protein FliJ [Lachnospiraceae bacterium]|nr:flagellar export protein FliJ [Lachnospiraceae bacterium]
MAKFKYKMANVLDIKMKMEDQAKSAFSIAMANLRAEEEKLDALIARKEEYEEKDRILRTSTLDISEIKSNAAAILNLKSQVEDQKANVRAAEDDVERARFRLDGAVKDRKIHEKLKENAFEEFKADIGRAESKEVDELVSYRYGSRE